MTVAAQVSAQEYGVVRIFALDPQLAMEIGHTGTYDRLVAALGIESLNAADVQIVQLRVIAEMGLSRFLCEGYGIAEDEIAPMAGPLDALTGEVAILRSGAFGGQAVTLVTDGEARLMALLHEPNPDGAKPMPLDYASAKGVTEPAPARKAPSDAVMSGRIAMLALIVMFALVGLMIWVAG